MRHVRFGAALLPKADIADHDSDDCCAERKTPGQYQGFCCQNAVQSVSGIDSSPPISD